MNGGELFLGGMAVFALITIAIKAQSGARRARAAADIASVEPAPSRCSGEL
jgi:hypothetical protein